MCARLRLWLWHAIRFEGWRRKDFATRPPLDPQAAHVARFPSMETGNASMFVISESALLISFAVIQVLGLTSLACARLKGDTLWNRSFRVLFMFSLVGVGMATMCAVGCASDWWISCGTTLAVMSVGGTIDLGSSAATAF